MMKISEAIRKGCQVCPNQAFNSFFFEADHAACALGAAGIGAGIQPTRVDQATLFLQFPVLGDDFLDTLESFYHRILFWNDQMRWTREEIADRLEEMDV